MIAFIGKEIADAISPIVMWGAIGGVVITLVILAIRKYNKGVVAEDDLEEAGDAEKSRKKASQRIRDNVSRLRKRWRDRRMSNSSGG